jgi:hypothetical protein
MQRGEHVTKQWIAKPLAAASIAVAIASTAFVGTAAAAGHPTVAFNWWKGRHYQRHWFGSVRPSVLGGKFGEPVQNLNWLHRTKTGAVGTGLVIHDVCQPCHVKVTLSHAKRKPSRLGPGRFFNWMDVHFRNDGTSHLRWSFRRGNWVGR